MASSLGNAEDEAARFYGAQLLFSGQLHQAITTAIELDLFDIIVEAGPISPSDIAARLKSSNPNAPQMIDRLLQLLASYDIVSASSSSSGDNKEENVFGPKRVCKFLINKNDDGFSLAAASRLGAHRTSHNTWLHMKDAILNGGIPFEKANGMPLFQYLDTDPEFHDIFFKGISSASKMAARMIVEVYKGFEGLSSLADVGGGRGMMLNMIISKYPNIKGINYDLPHVVAGAPSYPGIEHVKGDMFVSVPNAEAIFLKAVLHNWDDQHSVKLLQNCYKAIPEDGKVMIAERIRPAVPENASHEGQWAFHVHCLMMANHDGRERTEKEYKDLATAAGFQGFRVATRAHNLYIMELFKAAQEKSSLNY